VEPNDNQEKFAILLAAGTMPAAMMPATQDPASSTVGNAIRMASTTCGAGRRRMTCGPSATGWS
jgi:hypothetical protein